MKILITGANGFLASRISNYYSETHGIYGFSRQEMDFTDVATLQKTFQRINPEIVIHCGAISDTETCRKNPDRTWYSNVFGTGTVADACNQVDAKLIFCSSDQVYGTGDPSIAHKEHEEVSPCSIYGEQKLSAEKLAMSRNLDTVCLRLSWMYDLNHRPGEHSDLLGNLISHLENNEPMNMFANDYRCITDVWDVVRAMEKVWQLPAGTYNIGSSNVLSNYELLSRFLEPYENARKILVKDEKTFAESARNLRMDTTLIERYGIQLESALEHLNSIRDEFECICEQKNIIL